ncbi:MAG: response regulator [Flavobacteriales bacterium]|jgi:FixJ family two-component response regulator|nr:response regulator [Flavobacteriales bacterium]
MKKLLFVDDDHSTRILFQKAFRDQYDVLLAKSAKKALKILKKEEIPVIISDQVMPKQTGLELFELLAHRTPLSPSIKILITGCKDIDIAIHAINQGYVYKYIKKPFEIEELDEVLKHAYQLYSSRVKRKVLQQAIDQERETTHEQYARELHEDVAQNIAGVNFNLSLPQHHTPPEKPSKILQQTIQSIRNLSYVISPRLHEYGNLQSAIELLIAGKKRITINSSIQADLKLDKKLELHLYRLIQYFIKYYEAQNITNITFSLSLNKKLKTQLVFYSDQQSEYHSDFLETISIMIEPYYGQLIQRVINKQSSNCIIYGLY